MFLDHNYVCVTGVDLVFVIDESSSIRDINLNGFELIKQFVTSIINMLDIGLERDLVGVISFSNTANIQFDVTQHTDKSSLISAIHNLPYRGGMTNIGKALNLLRTGGQPDGALNLRNESTNIAVLVTDGASSDPQTTHTAAVTLHKSNLYDQVYVVGVTNQVNLAELKLIASNPSLVYNSVDFASLVNLVEAITQQLKSG